MKMFFGSILVLISLFLPHWICVGARFYLCGLYIKRYSLYNYVTISFSPRIKWSVTVMQTYEGRENYIFVSYAHKNSAEVMRILERLWAKGYRIWYDEGIVPGSEWTDYIASHVRNSAAVMLFISPESVASKYCNQEIVYALKHNKPILAVFLEKTELSDGLDLQLCVLQSIDCEKFSTEGALVEKICQWSDLLPCAGNAPAQRYASAREMAADLRKLGTEPAEDEDNMTVVDIPVPQMKPTVKKKSMPKGEGRREEKSVREVAPAPAAKVPDEPAVDPTVAKIYRTSWILCLITDLLFALMLYQVIGESGVIGYIVFAVFLIPALIECLHLFKPSKKILLRAKQSPESYAQLFGIERAFFKKSVGSWVKWWLIWIFCVIYALLFVSLYCSSVAAKDLSFLFGGLMFFVWAIRLVRVKMVYSKTYGSVDGIPASAAKTPAPSKPASIIPKLNASNSRISIFVYLGLALLGFLVLCVIFFYELTQNGFEPEFARYCAPAFVVLALFLFWLAKLK